ncbi:MAG: molybdopterin-dependent oxidoreductase [Candidatus Delongbacteria bacterium]|nr:molybdopterin-dependent oxidoreductase [Candidatus Delongbacteria bacterium]
MRYQDSELHVRGASHYTDDLPAPENTLRMTVFSSPIAHGRILQLDVSHAQATDGVIRVLTAQDIPGANQIGTVIQDEPLLSDHELHFIGQPIALVIAEREESARQAISRIRLQTEEWPAVFDPREAYRNKEWLAPPRCFSQGHIDQAWDECDIITQGRVDSGGQEHLYLEPQNTLAVPLEHGGIRIISSTQSPTGVQRIASRVLGLPMHRIEVDTPRLGGAFGGKEEQATPWAVMAALGAYHLRRPIKLILRRDEDMRLTGKRHPYSSDFKIGLDGDGKIIAYQVMFYQNAGAATDLSLAILERSLFHATNSYSIPNVKATACACRTNLPPFTAFRGFGAPQAMLVLESAIVQAARLMQIDPAVIQKQNLLHKGDRFPYGMRSQSRHAQTCWNQLHSRYKIRTIRHQILRFNASHGLIKKGMALIPVCFGISFTTTFMNQANALVHVYTDGSVGISTAAVEMGQGVSSKLIRIAARVLGINPERIKMESTNTTRAANTSPTAASTGTDLNGQAVIQACTIILKRLQRFVAAELGRKQFSDIRIEHEQVCHGRQKTGWHWEHLINQAYMARISLSAQAHYATPNLFFNRETNQGQAFAYHVYGTAMVQVTLDCLRGTYRFDSVKIVHDTGQSIDPLIDRGQVEGAVIQGLGWISLEELCYSSKGRLLTDSLSTYKIPDIHFAPDDFQLYFLPNAKNPAGPFHSKATGEPPFMYGIAGYFALLDAIRAYRPELEPDFITPLTPERVLMMLTR